MNFLQQRIERLRLRLLDLSRTNPLISARLSVKQHNVVRIVDEIPALVLNGLLDQQNFSFSPLPELDESLADEKTSAFQSALGLARATDQLYLDALAKIDDRSEDGDKAIKEIDRALRDRVRISLGLPRRPTRNEISLEDHAKAHGINPSYDLATGEPTDARHVDKRLQTLLLPEELLKKLNSLSDKDKTSADETGISVLKIAFGLLEWIDPVISEQTRSPLILLPVKIEKKKTPKGSTFSISSVGEEPRLNPVLVEKLSTEYGVKLPSFNEESDLELFFQEIDSLKPERLNFSCRRQIMVGVFPSQRESMYVDLDPEETDFSKSPIISDLFLGVESDGNSHLVAELYPNDDPTIEKHVTHLVMDADPSQFSALVDVSKEKNVAIEGPPGTGKSQTIVNIIANALGNGKKVLFVAEKTTALEVVRKRLEKVGLAEFSLPFQITRQGRAKVIESIRERINLRPKKSQDEFERSINFFKKNREEIQVYLRLLQSEVGQTRMSAYEIISKNIANRELTQTYSQVFLRANLIAVQELSPTRLAELLERAATLDRTAKELQGKINYWHPVSRPMTPVEIDDCMGKCEQLQLHTDTACTLLKNLGYFESTLPTKDRVQSLIRIAMFADQMGRRDSKWIRDRLAHEDHTGNFRKYRLFAIGGYRLAALKTQLRRDVRDSDYADITELTDLCEKYDVSELTPSGLLRITSDTDELEIALLDYLRNWESFYEKIPSLRSARFKSIYELSTLLNDASADLLNVLEDLPISIGTEEVNFWAQRGEALSESIDKVHTKIDRDLKAALLIAREIHDVFKSTGILGRLNPSYRRAKDVFCTVFKSQFTDKFSAEKILRDFISEVEKILAEQELLLNHPTFRKIFGATGSIKGIPFYLYKSLGKFMERLGEIFYEGNESKIPNEIRNLARPQLEFIRTEIPRTDDVYLERPQNIIELKRFHKELSASNAEKKSDRVRLGELLTRFPNFPTREAAKKLRRRLYKNARWNHEFLPGGPTTIPAISRPFNLAVDSPSFAMTVSQHISLWKLLVASGRDRYWALSLVERSGLQESVAELNSLSETLSKIEELIGYFEGRTGIVQKLKPLKSLTDKVQYLRGASGDRDGLVLSSDYVSLRNDMEAFDGEIVELWESTLQKFEVPFEKFFEAAVFYCLAKQLYRQHEKILTGYNGERLDSIRKNVREADLEFMRASSQEIASMLISQSRIPVGNGKGPKSTYTDLCLIKNEVAKTKRWISLRALVHRASSALFQLKPCWMMSPQAVAQYLPKDIEFDLCIIDEASQMPPEEAVGALSRCKQCVIVGDTNQLPPTNFFRKIIDDSDSDDDELVCEESVLELANAVFAPKRRLLHHYRSRHSSLISFSNELIYDGSLVVYPDVSPTRSGFGVSVKFVDGLYKSGVNPIEADAMVDAIVEFMRSNPNRSLGVVLLNQKQRERVLEGYLRAFEEYSFVSDYVERWESDERNEPFFIRNLENVQGDERDVVFIGTVYGREKRDAPVMQRFGPINGAAGRRRLNVLFSRAKEQIITFTSMRSADIVADENGNPGPYLLKKWLEFSQSGVINQAKVSGKEPDSVFEEYVIEQIKAMGFIAVPQVGVSGFFIDIGVKHPRFSDVYLIGVECDGAAFHSSTSARNRDRIREGVLRSLGWRLHRIWSTDWFKNAPREIEKLRQVLMARLKEVEHAISQEAVASGLGDGELDSRGANARSSKKDIETIEFDDGAVYTGVVKNGQAHGLGRYVFPDGAVYEGDFRDGCFDGKGVLKYPSGDTLQGDFKRDLAHGIGEYRYSHGATYVGQFRDGEFSGQGVYSYANGDCYKGEFAADKFNGRGVLIRSGCESRGIFKDGILIEPEL